MTDLREDLEVAYLRLMTEDIGNESTVTFRNAITTEIAKHLARQLVNLTLELIEEHRDEVVEELGNE